MVLIFYINIHSTPFQIVLSIFQYVLVHDSFRDFILSFETYELSKHFNIFLNIWIHLNINALEQDPFYINCVAFVSTVYLHFSYSSSNVCIIWPWNPRGQSIRHSAGHSRWMQTYRAGMWQLAETADWEKQFVCLEPSSVLEIRWWRIGR